MAFLYNPEFSLDKTYCQIYTGNGKGKTTATLGLALRHLGHGGRVLYTQFCKGDKKEFPSGEKFFINGLKKKIGWKIFQLLMGSRIDFINFGSKHKWEFPFNITQNDIAQAEIDFEFIEKNYHKYSLVVIDEASHAIKCGLIKEEKLIKLIDDMSGKTEIVLTGRNFPHKLLHKGHLITNMYPYKHYYNIGQTARKGVEY